MKRKYDFVFSLGSACLCSQSLRNAGLQYASYPLDWVWGGNMRMRADLVVGGFDGWFEKRDFQLCPNPGAFGHDAYVNRKTGMLFPHAYPKGVPIDESYPAVRERMDRQVARLYERLEKSGRVLIVWFGDARDEERVSRADVEYCLRSFSRRWPKTLFEMLALDQMPGVPAESMQRMIGPGFLLCAFDYRDCSPGAPVWAYRQDLVAPFLADVFARDYRTWKEKRRYRKARMERESARYGVSSRLELFWIRLQIRLCRHIIKKLHRRGVDIHIAAPCPQGSHASVDTGGGS